MRMLRVPGGSLDARFRRRGTEDCGIGTPYSRLHGRHWAVQSSRKGSRCSASIRVDTMKAAGAVVPIWSLESSSVWVGVG
jgi:hypothetical protein